MEHIRLDHLLDITSKILISLLLINLTLGCIFSTSCTYYIPTVFYLASMKGHDLLSIFVFGIQSFVMLVFFVAFHINNNICLTQDDKNFMKLQEIGIIGLFMIIGLIDETGGISIRPVDDVHRFISFALCVISILWTYWALTFMKKLDNFKPDSDYDFAWLSLKLFTFLFIFSLFQWVFTYSIYHNFLFNHTFESISEWLLVVLGLRLPYYISRSMKIDISALIKPKLKY